LAGAPPAPTPGCAWSHNGCRPRGQPQIRSHSG